MPERQPTEKQQQASDRIANCGNQTENSSSENPATPNQLTPEEQMALFEKDLKENDWGHQPC